MRIRLLAAAASLLAATVSAAPPALGLYAAPQYVLHRVGAFGGEPSIGSDSHGILYSTYLSDTNVFRSRNNGANWTATTVPDPSTGDDCIGFDQSDAVYWCNLAGSQSIHPLQADVWKSIDQGQSWTYGNNPVNTMTGANICGTSCQPFGVDRQWVDGYIPPGGTTDTAEVVLMYHDFGTGPSQIWVNISNDGGRTYGPSTDVLANLDTSAAAGGAVAQADSTCNTIPSAVKIAKSGPHAGRIFVAWIAADPSSLATGCNISQGQAYHNLIVAWSDDNGSTWVPQVAYDAGPFHDASSPFAAFNLDDQGNPYFGFVNNLNWDPTCAVPNNPQTTSCEYDMYVVWSPDGGSTWQGGDGAGNGSAGTLAPGSAATPYKVNTDAGTHWFPAIAAGDPGQVDVAYLQTDDIIPTTSNGKQYPGGCFTLGAPCTSQDTWDLWVGQSINLLGGGSANQNPTWTVSKVTTQPMHQGDICNLGIACPPTANRHLADFISEVVDPQGCAHVNFADDATNNAVMTADQVGGTCTHAAVVTASPSPSPVSSPTPATPPSPTPTSKPRPLPSTAFAGFGAPLLPMALLLVAVVPLLTRRRRAR